MSSSRSQNNPRVAKSMTTKMAGVSAKHSDVRRGRFGTYVTPKASTGGFCLSIRRRCCPEIKSNEAAGVIHTDFNADGGPLHQRRYQSLRLPRCPPQTLEYVVRRCHFLSSLPRLRRSDRSGRNRCCSDWCSNKYRVWRHSEQRCAWQGGTGLQRISLSERTELRPQCGFFVAAQRSSTFLAQISASYTTQKNLQ
jgi:hypothetical protein